MLADTIAWIFAIFFVEPFEAVAREKLAAARAPQEIVRQIGDCARRGGPILADKGLADPGWIVTTVARIWMGTVKIDAVLTDLDPNCAQAVEAARPYLQQ
jgi:hypothetical protein